MSPPATVIGLLISAGLVLLPSALAATANPAPIAIPDVSELDSGVSAEESMVSGGLPRTPESGMENPEDLLTSSPLASPSKGKKTADAKLPAQLKVPAARKTPTATARTNLPTATARANPSAPAAPKPRTAARAVPKRTAPSAKASDNDVPMTVMDSDDEEETAIRKTMRSIPENTVRPEEEAFSPKAGPGDIDFPDTSGNPESIALGAKAAAAKAEAARKAAAAKMQAGKAAQAKMEAEKKAAQAKIDAERAAQTKAEAERKAVQAKADAQRAAVAKAQADRAALDRANAEKAARAKAQAQADAERATLAKKEAEQKAAIARADAEKAARAKAESDRAARAKVEADRKALQAKADAEKAAAVKARAEKAAQVKAQADRDASARRLQAKRAAEPQDAGARQSSTDTSARQSSSPGDARPIQLAPSRNAPSADASVADTLPAIEPDVSEPAAASGPKVAAHSLQAAPGVSASSMPSEVDVDIPAPVAETPTQAEPPTSEALPAAPAGDEPAVAQDAAPAEEPGSDTEPALPEALPEATADVSSDPSSEVVQNGAGEGASTRAWDRNVPMYDRENPNWGFDIHGSLKALGATDFAADAGNGSITDYRTRNFGVGFEYEPSALQSLGVVSIGPSANVYFVQPNGGITSGGFSIFSLGGRVTYQLRFMRAQPIVPFAGFEVQMIRYNFKAETDLGNGWTTATGPVFGGMLLLNWMEPSAAHSLWSDTGIKRSYLVGELKMLKAGLDELSVDGSALYFGLRLEY